MYFYHFINIKYSMSDFLSPFPQLGTPSNNPIREPMDKKKKKKEKKKRKKKCQKNGGKNYEFCNLLII
jgi:hypothetical protein